METFNNSNLYREVQKLKGEVKMYGRVNEELKGELEIGNRTIEEQGEIIVKLNRSIKMHK